MNVIVSVLFFSGLLLCGTIILANEALKFRWGRWIVVAINVAILLALGVNYIETSHDKYGLSRFFERAVREARLYELSEQFLSANAGERDILRPALLRACREAGGPWIASGAGLDQASFATAQNIGWDNFSEGGNRPALSYVWLIEESESEKERANAFYWLATVTHMGGGVLCGPLPHDLDRIRGLLENDDDSSESSHERVLNLGDDWELIAAYSLSGYYARTGQFSTALERLKRAFGPEWVSAGKIRPGWKKELAPLPMDHVYFGYILYQTGHEREALREFSAATGRPAGLDTMRKAYMDWPEGVE